MLGIARAHTNIALIKYWGKKDKDLFLPMTSSLSLTLDAFYTDTKVQFDPSLQQDEFYLNLIPQEATPITRFLNLFRQYMDKTYYARVESLNFVPTGAGLASSASAFAALAGAINVASQLHFDAETLSTFARQGSGSATRSIYGGFVEWEKGTSSQTSLAKHIDNAEWDIGMIIIVVNTKEKTISSRSGMEHTVKTSPFYPAWVESSKQDLIAIKKAIHTKNFQTVGEIMEWNSMKMHATMLGANPPFSYFEPESILAHQQVYRLRQLGLPVYMTMDAGPNVKLLCRASDMDTIKKELSSVFSKNQLISSLPGKAMRTLTEKEWEHSLNTFKEHQL
ncbi:MULTISPECIES: diphosphomevalonate decarboxylase [unclassified Granulicatella]|uniref:diphosphomevalonate decarboxylase n=1 Tax=unclassified Granulicatella TaxID=2630493 RepID=UPI001073753A|nr:MULTISPECIES: diphosphomevalonate decarboxylase [unclassified Granulicatella]MBF0780812.1 diphosphomevalonate decarboxylase [Granulicatella sp. 19428wC4_WM01]TFU93798.1 diphosphomevalonate decarboxylase [Granulicatella sp. WM01]